MGIFASENRTVKRIPIKGVVNCNVLCWIFNLATIGAPICGFLILFSEACYQLNNWIRLLLQKIKTNDEFESIQECSRLFKQGLKKTNDAFSTTLFWIITLYLISMILTGYFAMSFLFYSNEEKITFSKISRSSAFFLGASCVVLTVYFINCLSHEVTKNLHELKDCISELDIPLDEKWDIIEKMNSFHGFEACGFFTLGRPLLTTIVASFTTFIIVLIQFKLGEK